MIITFTVPCVPIAQPRQRHRVMQAAGRTFAQNYTPDNHPVQAFKATCRLAAQQVGCTPIVGPVYLELLFTFPRPKRLQWKNKTMHAEWHTSKPDLDNLEKSVKDALTGICWQDDAQVCSVVKRKIYGAGGDPAGVRITVGPEVDSTTEIRVQT